MTLPIDHPTAVLVLDETGVITHPENRFFGMGCMKLTDHAEFDRRIQNLRDKYSFRQELHWAELDSRDASAAAGLTPNLIPFAKEAMAVAFELDSVSFHCLISDRGEGDLTAQFRHARFPAYLAYQRFAAQNIDRLITGDELVTVIADQMSTPAQVHFEAGVKDEVNTRRGQLAVTTVTRIDSCCHNGLQVIDLILGAAAHDLRRGRDDVVMTQKQEMLQHLHDLCGKVSFRPDGGHCRDGKWCVEILRKSGRARRRGSRGGR